jgi:hypothetical protein
MSFWWSVISSVTTSRFSASAAYVSPASAPWSIVRESPKVWRMRSSMRSKSPLRSGISSRPKTLSMVVAKLWTMTRKSAAKASSSDSRKSSSSSPVGIHGTLVPRSLALAPSLASSSGVYSRSEMASIAVFSISSWSTDRNARIMIGMPRLWKVSASNFTCLSSMFETGIRLFSPAKATSSGYSLTSWLYSQTGARLRSTSRRACGSRIRNRGSRESGLRSTKTSFGCSSSSDSQTPRFSLKVPSGKPSPTIHFSRERLTRNFLYLSWLKNRSS